MKRFVTKTGLLPVLLMLTVLLGLSCKKDSDVMASAGNISITRGAFREWISAKRFSSEEIMKSRDMQKRYLSHLAVEMVSAERARAEGFDKNDYFLRLQKLVYANLLASHFARTVKEGASFSEECADISIIRVFMRSREGKGRGKFSEKDWRDKESYVRDRIITALQSGLEFGEAARRFSDDPSAKKGGHIGFISGPMMGDEVHSVVKKLHAGEFSKVPLRLRNALYVIKVNRRAEINNENLHSIVKDKKNAESLEKYIRGMKLRQLGRELEVQSGVVSRIKDARFKGKKELLFSVNGEKFNTGDLDDILTLFHELRFGSGPVKPLTVNSRRRTAERIFSERLLAGEAKKRNVDTTEEFRRKWRYVERAALSGSYKFSRLSKKVVIPEKEISDQYRAYLRKKSSVKNRSRRGYVLTRDDIRRSLFRKKITLLRGKWEKELLHSAGYRVNEDNLEGE